MALLSAVPQPADARLGRKEEQGKVDGVKDEAIRKQSLPAEETAGREISGPPLPRNRGQGTGRQEERGRVKAKSTQLSSSPGRL